ncbi:MAG: hypothetical protein G01um10145_907, partial [Microgenomates group bacterium Gr01-1014_5]
MSIIVKLMNFNIRNKFLLLSAMYALLGLLGLLLLSFSWLPPGNAIVGHDSGLPLDANEFL